MPAGVVRWFKLGYTDGFVARQGGFDERVVHLMRMVWDRAEPR